MGRYQSPCFIDIGFLRSRGIHITLKEASQDKDSNEKVLYAKKKFYGTPNQKNGGNSMGGRDVTKMFKHQLFVGIHLEKTRK